MNAALSQVQPFLLADTPWTEVRDGNRSAMALYLQHYSARRYVDGRPRNRFVGPGFRMVLLTPDARALFVWRKFFSKDDQQGVNCAVFRNEGSTAGRSSDLILAAMARAWERWPGQRLYTYVNQRRVASANPGYCFKCAGWRPCGVTSSRRLLVLEALP